MERQNIKIKIIFSKTSYIKELLLFNFILALLAHRHIGQNVGNRGKIFLTVLIKRATFSI